MVSLDDIGNDVVGRQSKGRDELFKRDVKNLPVLWVKIIVKVWYAFCNFCNVPGI
jgi:hypothetical protein